MGFAGVFGWDSTGSLGDEVIATGGKVGVGVGGVAGSGGGGGSATGIVISTPGI